MANNQFHYTSFASTGAGGYPSNTQGAYGYQHPGTAPHQLANFNTYNGIAPGQSPDFGQGQRSNGFIHANTYGDVPYSHQQPSYQQGVNPQAVNAPPGWASGQMQMATNAHPQVPTGSGFRHPQTSGAPASIAQFPANQLSAGHVYHGNAIGVQGMTGFHHAPARNGIPNPAAYNPGAGAGSSQVQVQPAAPISNTNGGKLQWKTTGPLTHDQKAALIAAQADGKTRVCPVCGHSYNKHSNLVDHILKAYGKDGEGSRAPVDSGSVSRYTFYLIDAWGIAGKRGRDITRS
ncbi:hypothetical protein BDN72DRAFT_905173 [Pluteus cervinus]|uniref:Uncharacterized protein n=1 Tax=Pluteus cervinus TaxID=181527 RepID=A0ACD3A3A6_9AGAR|nr:hypothetical protein BDN72DRAFT_905173 [Pluteus cervinus]